ncbi:hypothetical protein TorRG33x02_155970 [Trema orientale]|uniref:Uncharacterized protein n=1 Tax=Trema orientale TaxID=63057 RepID=A0A2P5ESM6_TREOI|nr:hypothetical protein TorRG33x02_155970 [Trema orientale]
MTTVLESSVSPWASASHGLVNINGNLRQLAMLSSSFVVLSLTPNCNLINGDSSVVNLNRVVNLFGA